MNPPLWMLVFLVVATARTLSRRHAPARPYATFWPRLFAGWIDSLVLWPVMVVDSWVGEWNPAPALAATRLVVTSFVGVLYGTFCHARWGQTLGKWVFGVCVLDLAEGALRPWQALKRDLALLVLTTAWVIQQIARGSYGVVASDSGGVLAWLSMAWFATEVLTMLTNPKRRALHDWIAGTVVVRVVPMWRRGAD